jgi:hypothetical protein
MRSQRDTGPPENARAHGGETMGSGENLVGDDLPPQAIRAPMRGVNSAGGSP